MENWSKRAAILLGFGSALAIALLFALNIRPGIRTTQPESEPALFESKAGTKAVRSEPLPPAPVAPRIPGPAPVTPGASIARHGEGVSQAAALKDLLAPGATGAEGRIDQAEIERAIRDYINRYKPQLRLSDSEYERAADAIARFRDMGARMRLTDRTDAAQAAIFRKYLREMEAAMREFREITDMSPQDFFTGESPPVLFGGDEWPPPAEDEAFEDFLSNHGP